MEDERMDQQRRVDPGRIRRLQPLQFPRQIHQQSGFIDGVAHRPADQSADMHGPCKRT